MAEVIVEIERLNKGFKKISDSVVNTVKDTVSIPDKIQTQTAMPGAKINDLKQQPTKQKDLTIKKVFQDSTTENTTEEKKDNTLYYVLGGAAVLGLFLILSGGDKKKKKR